MSSAAARQAQLVLWHPVRSLGLFLVRCSDAGPVGTSLQVQYVLVLCSTLCDPAGAGPGTCRGALTGRPERALKRLCVSALRGEIEDSPASTWKRFQARSRHRGLVVRGRSPAENHLLPRRDPRSSRNGIAGSGTSWHLRELCTSGLFPRFGCSVRFQSIAEFQQPHTRHSLELLVLCCPECWEVRADAAVVPRARLHGVRCSVGVHLRIRVLLPSWASDPAMQEPPADSLLLQRKVSSTLLPSEGLPLEFIDSLLQRTVRLHPDGHARAEPSCRQHGGILTRSCIAHAVQCRSSTQKRISRALTRQRLPIAACCKCRFFAGHSLAL